MVKWSEFIDKYMPGADRTDSALVYGYGAAQTLAKVLELCGDDLSRANVMKQAASLKDFVPGHAVAGREDQHQRQRFRAHQPVTDAALQGREMGTVRRHHQRRRRLSIRLLSS